MNNAYDLSFPVISLSYCILNHTIKTGLKYKFYVRDSEISTSIILLVVMKEPEKMAKKALIHLSFKQLLKVNLLYLKNISLE